MNIFKITFAELETAQYIHYEKSKKDKNKQQTHSTI